MKIVTIVGARPQFIKAAILSRLIRSEYAESIDEYIIHTGQHYDANMSDVFFSEMKIPKPDINLSIGSGSHGKMTGEMLIAIERELMRIAPHFVLIYGDTNSTLAGALAAGKLHIPVVHVEAGLRSFNMAMPEEQNRIIADKLSTFLFCPTPTACENLEREGIRDGVHNVGDIMYDVNLYYREINNRRPVDQRITAKLDLPGDYSLLTLHRAENTDSRARVSSIFSALSKSKNFFLFPIHPRTKKTLATYNVSMPDNVMAIDPVGFLDMIELETNAGTIVTDSGGIQKEAYFFNKPCVTLRDETEWIETVDYGYNVLTGADEQSILDALEKEPPKSWAEHLYGEGDTGQRILNILTREDSHR